MAHAPESNPFRAEVAAQTDHGDRIGTCIQCGACGGSCPNGADMEYSPRQVIHLVNAGMRDEALRANTPWMCVSCYLCTSRCPQTIPITEVMYTLKRMSLAEGVANDGDGGALARAFADNIRRYGRSFELGLASSFYLLHRPGSLLRMGPLGLKMMTRGRMNLAPTRIRQVDQVRAILDAAMAPGGEA